MEDGKKALKIARNLIRVGLVSSVDEERATVRVYLPDKDGIVTDHLKLLNFNHEYYIPKVGAQVVCVFLGNGLEQGFVLGEFYHDGWETPVDDKDIVYKEFNRPTDCHWKYNKDDNTWYVQVKNDITIVSLSDGIKIKADSGDITFEADRIFHEQSGWQKSRVGVPPGGIIMWSGSTNQVPLGWALCDGSGGTPDLRDKFVIGAGGQQAVGSGGGSNSVTITEAQMPSHNHSNPDTGSGGWHSHGSGTLSADTAGSHEHSYDETGSNFRDYHSSAGASDRHTTASSSEKTSSAGSHSHDVSGNTGSAGSHSHSLGDTGETGGGDSLENRPAFYALAYIIKL